ncbi:MAG: bifunctional oligoribonuclease/PAP phosphatase NrnA [Clostridia bacterium]
MKKILLSTQETADLLIKFNKIALICHSNPDGDTIGSAIGLSLSLSQLNKTCKVFCDEQPNEKISRFIPENFQIYSKIEEKFDLIVAIDCGDVFRLGELSGEFSQSLNTLSIDHHNGLPYAVYNCLFNTSSTAEIILDIIKVLNVNIDSTLANLLYLAISTDTGNFSHANTTADTLANASYLARHNVSITKVNRTFFKEISFNRTKLLGRMLERVRSYYDGLYCLVYIMKKDLADYNCTAEDASDVVNYAININTAKIAVSVFEYAENVYKVSMRGKDVSIREICEFFGGGGHQFASGCQISGFFEDVLEKIKREVEDTLSRLNLI